MSAKYLCESAVASCGGFCAPQTPAQSKRPAAANRVLEKQKVGFKMAVVLE
jgi:hypothetical protein